MDGTIAFIGLSMRRTSVFCRFGGKDEPRQGASQAMEPLDRLEALVAIMDRLREPQGCPWDREQDYLSLRRYLLEECYEVAEAIDRGVPSALR